MPRVPNWRRYLRFWRSDIRADIDAELQFHLDERVEELMTCGAVPISHEDAVQQARAELGDEMRLRTRLTEIDQRVHARQRSHASRDRLAQDLRYALRGLRRSPGFAALAFGTLALGVGASTAMYSVIDTMLLNPLHYRGADRIVALWEHDPRTGIRISGSPDEVAQAHSFEAIESFGTGLVTMTGHGDPLLLHAGKISSTFVGFVGSVPFRLGRNFDARETSASGAPVVILSERLWRGRFGALNTVLGQHIVLDDTIAYTIIGVVSDDLRLPAGAHGDIDLWLPLSADQTGEASRIARLRRGISIAAAERELDSITAHLDSTSMWRRSSFSANLVRPGDDSRFRDSLYLLGVAVALLLLIACANVAHLLLGRGAAREREIAIRLAIGASRARVARQLLTESALLAMSAAAVGIGVAALALHILRALHPTALYQLADVRLDGAAVGIAVVISVGAGIICGTIAALHAIRRGTAAALSSSVPSGTGTRRRRRVRSALVMSEMAFSAMLLVGASLLVRTVANLDRVRPGFDPSNLYRAEVEPARTADGRVDYTSRLIAGARAIPGVMSATIAASVPPQMIMPFGDVRPEGADVTAPIGPSDSPGIIPDDVPPEYFATLGIPLIAGHTFDNGSRARDEVIISEATAHRLWPETTAVGKRFTLVGGDQGGYVFVGRTPNVVTAAPTRWLTVIGVVPDVVSQLLVTGRASPTIYYPYSDHTFALTLAVRTQPGVDPTSSLRRLFLALQPGRAPPSITSVEQDIMDLHESQQFTMALLSTFAALAVILSAVGLYGVISYMVAQRTREIGVRVALGAAPRHIGRTVIVRGLALATSGLAIGLIASLWGTKLIRASLFGVQPNDAGSYLVGGLVLLALAIIACIVPTRRAMAVDPLIAMRAE